LLRASDVLRITLPAGMGRVTAWQLNLDRITAKDAKEVK